MQSIKAHLFFHSDRLFVFLILLKISFPMPFRSSKKSHHSQSYRVLIFSGEIITNKTQNHGKCAAQFHISTKRTCKCASYLGDGVKLSNSTTFFTAQFFIIFRTSYIIYRKPNALIENPKFKTPKFNLFLLPCKKSQLFNSVCSRRLAMAIPG